MPPKSEDKPPVRRETPPAIIYLSVGSIGLLILALVYYGFYIGERMTSLDAPMMNAVGKIKLEAAITGLMVEEILNNGIVGGLEESWEPLDTAVSHLRRLAETQADWKTAFLPFQQPGLLADMDELEKKRAEWKDGANRRVREERLDFVQDDAELHYQAVFFEFMGVVNRLEDQVREILTENLRRFRYAQGILFLSCLGLTILAGMVLFRFERQRTRHLKELLLTGERLTIEIEDRKRTARVLSEQTDALERSNRDLQQFAYVASHDLQEPLRMVSSYVKLLERRYKGKLDADADDFIGFAVDGAARMQRMIQDLLSYSRVETLGRPPSWTDTREVFRQVVANLRVAMEESGARITHDPLPVVEADPTQLSQLFQNLIANAIKFRREIRPVIHMAAVREDRFWAFSVQDNGIGFDTAFADRIFTIFQRLHTRKDYPGTGIGLAICKKIVERHGGSIRVESEPGLGSTFYFTLPASE
ncbi:ATP-binding protein [Desulfosarcina sp.]|uniref:sensor histidine kinase n=1 Tax=Desulfosarcina sp. TaxID=2027861 RepID=UPI0035694A8C